MTVPKKKISFGIPLDGLLKEKQKLQMQTGDKYQKESETASNQKERREIKRKLLEEQREAELLNLNRLLTKPK
jgi:hypothetical protein